MARRRLFVHRLLSLSLVAGRASLGPASGQPRAMSNLESGSDDGEMPAIGWHPQQASQDFQTPDVAAAAKAAAPKEAASPGGRVPPSLAARFSSIYLSIRVQEVPSSKAPLCPSPKARRAALT
jgi:hypothetical protein